MATIQRSTTKVANKLVSYAEKRAVERGGVNCGADYAKTQFKATRQMWGKTDGIQAHHVIQSFKPDEIDPKKANEIGMKLAEKIAPGYEVAVYTHADKKHIHNHIVINSVNPDTGKKYHAHGTEELLKIRAASDEICLENDLSVVKEHNSPVRYKLAEKALLEKGQISWKDEIRQAVSYAKVDVTSLTDLEKSLKKDFNIEMKLRGNTISFKHPDQKRFIRGKSLGYPYEKEGIENEFTRKIEAEREWSTLDKIVTAVRENERNRTSELTPTGTPKSADRNHEAHIEHEQKPEPKIPKRNRNQDFGLER
ncbi:MAG TPA: relaxase/mobilization nuclease domain-containing protein [Candidatus Enterococcus avicola]|uniref:Relaxase/mobilization nuclease domain-containing protein n=1 Tax=Candidatus Enterococcus avicola TaxID=2838561 RepID=A0A9D2F9P8_9ENTE|nr:relaxase/mobilization nuclease domain-containing protein [Candidatus Enterococcus avicola]